MTQPVRNTAPSPLPPMPFNIAQAKTVTLENGLKIVMFADKRLPLVSYRLAFLAGDANEPTDKIGVTSAVAAMMTEGTDNYSSRELAEKIERLGAAVSAATTEDFFIVAGSSLSMYASDVLSLIAEVIFRPTFPEDELDLYKRNAIENLKFQRSQPNFLAGEQVAKAVYGEHPYSIVSPSPSDIENLNRESLRDFHQKLFIPNNAILVVVGDIEENEFLDQARDLFGGWNRGLTPSVKFSEPPRREKRETIIVDRPGSAQANIVLANIAFSRNNPDFFAATVMNQILGAGASSRVFMNLREEKGYTYGAYTRLDPKRLAGDFEATTEVRTAVTGDSLREFFYELNRIRDEKASDDELADAKNFLTGVFPIRAETQEGLTNLIVNQQLYGLPSDYLQTYRDNIEKITADDVVRVANKYVQPDDITIVIVGDAGEILPQVREYADSIRIIDTEGHPLDMASFEQQADEPSVDASGTWELSLDFQGQKVPVSLELQHDDGKLTGKIETVIGTGVIENGSIRGKKLTAAAITEIQGQSVEFSISGTIDADSIEGTLSAPIIPDSLAFEGKRVS
ncbi:MAG TPA: pitrilysin family protein [Pyrinomonadaceae bacterium]|nr:pitrilysin family protein [Pyrinomonadaceae bacterium]